MSRNKSHNQEREKKPGHTGNSVLKDIDTSKLAKLEAWLDWSVWLNKQTFMEINVILFNLLWVFFFKLEYILY